MIREKDMEEERNRIRIRFRKKRDEMPAALVHQRSLEISGRVLDWELYRQATRIFFYYPLGTEVSLVPVMKHALQSRKRIAFPRVNGSRMDFYEVADLEELKEGSFHVMEPESRDRTASDRNPQLCFVPGIVFDRMGGRFGYGKGYYDRYFQEQGSVKLTGCAYDFQIVEKLPVTRQDVRMDYLLSEKGIVQAAAGLEGNAERGKSQ